MRRIQIKWLKACNAILCAVLGVLGVNMSSCNNETLDEYGVPSADYTVLGKVTDSQTNQPVKDIQVEIYGRKIASTNTEGKYEFTMLGGGGSGNWPVSFRDIDGDLNGSYTDLDTIVEFKDPVFTGGDGRWYSGKATKEFNIQLNTKE